MYTTNESFLIWFSSSRQVDAFDFLIKIRFFNSLYLAFLTWLFSTSFFSMLLSIGWFAVPSLFTTVLYSLKKGDSLHFSENDNHDAHSIWSIIPNICLQGIKLEELWTWKISHAPHFDIALFYCFSWSYSFRILSSKLLRLIMKPLWKYYIGISIHSRSANILLKVPVNHERFKWNIFKSI